MELTVLCLTIACVYFYFDSRKMKKRIGVMESSLDEMATVAAGTPVPDHNG
mgnify:CR=1 FL=1